MWRMTCLVLAAATLAACGAKTAIYDPSRDPQADVRTAAEQARREQKHIVLVIGGDWCVWCVRLDRFIRDTPEIAAAWNAQFVTVHVNSSPENENAAFLGTYPRIQGYPHIFVLDRDGRLLHSQDTSVLEAGKGYSPERMKAFLEQWKPKPGGPRA